MFGSSFEGSMMERTLEGWLQERKPGVPGPLLPMLMDQGDGAVEAPALAARGEDSLRKALAAPGRNREGAFQLLVGDAFLTYAVEALAEEDDVGSELEALLQGLGGRFQR